jgi:hypothetical protein
VPMPLQATKRVLLALGLRVVFMEWSTWALLCLEDLRKKDADGSIAP